MLQLQSEVVPKPTKALQDESYGPCPLNQAVKLRSLPSRLEHLTHGGGVALFSTLLSLNGRSIFAGAACR